MGFYAMADPNFRRSAAACASGYTGIYPIVWLEARPAYASAGEKTADFAFEDSAALGHSGGTHLDCYDKTEQVSLLNANRNTSCNA